MNDQFDKKLADRINEVFEHFEDNSAAEGWQKLQAKKPEGNRRPVAWWWWFSSAAAVLILAGLWLPLSHNSGNNDSPAHKAAKERVARKNMDDANSSDEQGNAAKNTVGDVRQTKGLTAGLSPSKQSVIETERAEQQQEQVAMNAQNSPVTREKLTNTQSQASVSSGTRANDRADNANSQVTPVILANNRAQNIQMDSVPLASVSAKDIQQTPANALKMPIQKVVISKPELPELEDVATETQEPKKAKGVSLGLYAGSFMNYSEGSESNLNTAIGLASEFRINKRLKFVTGISVGRNSLSYANMIPKEAAQAYLSAPNSVNKGVMDQFYGQPSSNVLYNISSFDARLTGLDVPLNLRYTLKENRTKIYITTGFSSNFYIDESYTYSVNYRSVSQNMINDIPGQQTTSKYSSINLARVMNFSVGLNYPLSKRSTLSLEPYVKHPLSGLGSQNLKFGAAGLNIILNFDAIK